MQHTDYNYWLDEDGDGRGPFTVRLTDVFGHQATVAGITLSPLKRQKTTTMMYGPAAPKRTPSAKPSIRPSIGPSIGPSMAPATSQAPAPDLWAQTGLSCKHD